MKTNLVAGLLCCCFSLSGQIATTFITEFAVSSPAVPQAIAPDKIGKPYFYLAAKAGGLRVYDVQDFSQPVLVKTIPIAQLNGLEVMNASQRGNLLYLALGNFFGNNGQKPGLAILDVNDPANPVVKDVWEWDMVDRGSASVTLSGDYAYLAAMSQGLIILNVFNPDSIQFVSQIIPDPDFPVPNPPAAQVPNARGLALKGDVAFLCYDAGGLRVINVADKSHPVETGRYINPTPFVPAGKQQAFNNILLDGDTAFVAVDYCGMEVLDISDTANIQQKAWWNPWQCQSITNAWLGSPGHTNQLQLDTANHLVFLASAQSELSILDISDPNQPILAGGYGSTDNQLGTWGMALDGNRVYLVYIIAVFPFVSNWAGVKLLEWSQPSGVGEPDLLKIGNPYPNPFEYSIGLDIESDASTEWRVQMLDAQGRVVAQQDGQRLIPGSQHLQMDFSTLPTGIYQLMFISSSGVRHWSIVKG